MHFPNYLIFHLFQDSLNWFITQKKPWSCNTLQPAWPANLQQSHCRIDFLDAKTHFFRRKKAAAMTEKGTLLKLAGGMAVGTTALMFASSALKKSLNLEVEKWLEDGWDIVPYIVYNYMILYIPININHIIIIIIMIVISTYCKYMILDCRISDLIETHDTF